MNKDAAPLEQIFDNKTARFLDHLITMKPFDYTTDELCSILGFTKIELAEIVNHIRKFGFIEATSEQKIKIAENPRTLALSKFMYETAIYNCEQQTKKGKR